MQQILGAMSAMARVDGGREWIWKWEIPEMDGFLQNDDSSRHWNG